MSAVPALHWLNAPAWLPLVYALLHTLWQGALAAGGLFLVLRFVPTHRANLRYGLSAVALVLIVLAGVSSWAMLDAPRHPPASKMHSDRLPTAAGKGLPTGLSPSAATILPVPTGGVAAIRNVSSVPVVGEADASGAKRWAQWVAAVWLLGVSVSLLRTASGTLGAGRLRHRCRELTDLQVLALAEQLRARLDVSRRVKFLVCEEIGVPSMLGVLYPAVLLPASMLTGVPLEQLRAILAHELAHIRRWDYLANLAQMLVEALLFFNPFVWWISRQMRLERETCCDQIAAEECQSPACYVEVLVAVIERSRLAAAVSPPVLAASGPDAHGGNVLERSRRLLVPGYQPEFRIRWFSLAAVLVMSMSALSGLWLSARAVAQTIQASGEKIAPKLADGPDSPAAAHNLPAGVLDAAREGNAKQALTLLEASLKPKRFGEEDAARILDDLVRTRELRAFTTLYDALRNYYAKDWKLGDELLAALVKDGRTDFLDALIVRRFDLGRLTKATEPAGPATAAWITRRIAEVTRQQADIEAICQAAAGNNLPTLRRMVEEGADMNGVGKDDNTPLIRAVFKNQLEAAQFLLDHGAQVDKPRLPGSNYTPLCLVNSVPMAELLRQHGANVRAKLYGREVSIFSYVVMWAPADVVAWFIKQGADAKAMGDHHENLLFGLKDGATAEALLKAGADPNVLSEFDQTPLTSTHSAAVARALIQRGADLKPTLKDGATLLEQTIYRTRRQDSTPEEDAALIEEFIKQGAEFDPKGNGARAMVRAAFYDRVGEVRVFLDHGVSPDAVDDHDHSERRSALASAAYQGPHVLKLLLERGANPNAPLEDGQISPLSAALASRNFECADLLRQAGAAGIPELAYYSAKGDEAKVDALLAQHVDPNEADSSSWTPLRYAVQHGVATIAKQLLDHGATVDQFDHWGFTPYVSFRLYKNMIEGDASQAKMQWKVSLQEATARLAAFQQLFEQYPPNPAYRNATGRTALHQAVWNGSFILGIMLDKSLPHFDPNLPDKEGRTALLLAALSPSAKETGETITAGTDTPQRKTWNHSAYTVQQLLEAGARLDLPGPGGKTVGELALLAARDANNPQLVAVLTDALAAKAGPGSASPAPTLGSSAPAASPGKEAASATNPLQDLADLEPGQRDAIWTAAFAASKAGDIQTIEGFLRRGLDVNVDLENSSSLLFNAVDNNQLAIVKLLLAHGADILQKTSWGDVPLQRACWKGYKEVADILIQAGAPVNELWYATGMGDVPALEARDKRQPITPKEARDNLSFAVASGHPNTFDFLWKKLGSLDDKDKEKLLGDLYENVGTWNQPSLLPTLESLGADPARDGSRALVHAASANYPATVKALLERGVSPDLSPPRWGNMLRNAAGEGHLEVVRRLLDHGANINFQDDHGFTSLSWAAYNGQEDVCLLLLERGADGRIEDRDGHNATWHAAAGPHCAEALAQMIKQDVPVTGKDKRGATILEHMTNFATPQSFKGAFFQKVYSPADVQRFNESERRVVELLLAAGVNPNGPEGGPIPLIEAMHSEHYPLAQALLAHGADATLQDKDGNTAIYSLIGYAQGGPLPLDLFKTLLERSGNPNRELSVPGMTPPVKTSLLESLIGWAAESAPGILSWREAVGMLLDAGAEFAGVTNPQAQALLQAAARGNLPLVQETVRRGTSIDATDANGWGLLSIAVALGYDDCADWLIANGADVNGANRAPWTSPSSPLSLAIGRGQADLVDKLLAKGAKLDGVYGGLYQAVEQKNAQMFAALLKAGADPKEKSNVTMSFSGGKTYTPRNSVMLYLCIEKGLTDMARTLLDRGAEADPTNLEENRNLAYWAVYYDRPAILQSLLDHGSNPLTKDDKGESALDLARKSHPKLMSVLEGNSKRESAPAM